MSSSLPPALRYEVFALADVLSPDHPALAQRVTASMASFPCERSAHIQDFARSKVAGAERYGASRTYVLLVPDREFGVDVGAFFTVGLVNISFENASKALKKKLTGSTTRDKAGAYSIAELARSDRYGCSELPGSVILDEAKQVIARARRLVTGRFVVVDSQPHIFERLYRPAGFKQVDVATPPIGMEEVDFVTSCCDARDWCE